MASWAQASHETEMDQAKKAVDALVHILHQNLKSDTGITVSEIVKAGSMGHGTAVLDHFDLDLVLYSRDVNADTVQANGVDHWLNQLKRFLERNLGRKFRFYQQTPYSVQFNYDGIIEVDLLISPYWPTPKSLYDFLRTVPAAPPKERYKFTVNASKWQVEFLQHKPNQVKEFIRRAKAWRNEKWPKHTGGTGKPKSYLLSVLVLHAYEEACKSVDSHKTQEIAKKTTSVLQYLVHNHSTLDVYWEVYYKRRDYPNLLPARPRIIDPANPTNNLYKTGITNYRPNDRISDYGPGDGNWTAFKRNISTLDLTIAV